MKNLIWLFLFIPCMLFAQAKKAEPVFTINGLITGLADGTEIKILSAANNSTVATANAVKGKFTLSGSVTEPTLHFLLVGSEPPVYFYLENSKISITGAAHDLKNLKFYGSKSHLDFQSFQKIFDPLFAEMNNTASRLKVTMPGLQRDSLLVRYNAAIYSIQLQIDKFVFANRSSYISPFLLYVTSQLYDDPILLENRYNLLDSAIKNSEIGKFLNQHIAISKIGAVGTTAINFVQSDTSGKSVSLSSFTGQYVLLNFWASWCRACRDENPNIVAHYRKFKDKNFTVLGVSLDRPGQKESWVKAIHDDNLTWTHVSDLQFWNNAAAQLYHVSSIPQNYLIDPNGKIIARNLRGEALEAKLCELLGCE